MGSSIYDVEVVAVGEEHIDLFIDLLHIYLGRCEKGKTFALRLLWNPIHEHPYCQEQRVLESPLAKEMDLEDYLSPDWIDANAQGFIKNVEVLSETHEEDAIDSTLRITVTHPGWIAHVRRGMIWDTSAYGLDDGKSWEGRPKRRPGDRIEEVSDDPMEGMSLRSFDEKAKEMLKGTDATELILANHGTKQYVIKNKLEGDTLTLDAVRALAGQPVLVQTKSQLRVGTLIKTNENHFCLYNEKSSGFGSIGCRIDEVEFMGRAWFVRRIPIDGIEV